MKTIWILFVLFGNVKGDQDPYPCNDEKVLIAYDKGSEIFNREDFQKEIHFLANDLFDKWTHTDNLALLPFANSTDVDFQSYGSFADKAQVKNFVQNTQQQKKIDGKADILTVFTLYDFLPSNIYKYFPSAKVISWEVENINTTPDDWENEVLLAYGCADNTTTVAKPITLNTTPAAKLGTTTASVNTTENYTKVTPTKTTPNDKDPTAFRKRHETKTSAPPFSTASSTKDKSSSTYYIIYALFGTLLFIMLLTAMVICFCVYKIRTEASNSTQTLLVKSLRVIANLYSKNPNDPWEIQLHCLRVDYNTKLGSGNFGEVYVGHLEGNAAVKRIYNTLPAVSRFCDCNVAVKMLLPMATKESREEFSREINLMKFLKPHPHLVTFLGYVVDRHNLFLILEYCTNGNLLNYLQSNKEQLEQESNVVNTLIRFSRQISSGLKYIASLGLIHRDIAARNVLLTSNKICKVGDYGLCRSANATKSQIYLSRAKRLPIRWLALESLKSFEFSTKTDVWSYGILLYEVFTLGEIPYKDMENADILRFLDSGERLSKPLYATTKIYDLMKDCWQSNPIDRPNFAAISQRLNESVESLR